MIRHIVMFKLDENLSKEDKENNEKLLKSELESLTVSIDEVKFLEVGVNISSSPRAYDMVLVTEFESLKDLNTYRNHEEHQKVLLRIKPLFDKSIVVDY